jgi:predicted membrane-bound spermidine synthase
MKKASFGLYYWTAFFSGMAVMVLELSFSRLLAPYFGNSLYVWTNVIGLVMLALSFGYILGGRLADSRPEPKVYFALVFSAGLLSLFIPFLLPLLMPWIAGFFSNLSLVIILGSFLATFAFLVLPMLYLGMIVPFTVKLVTSDFKHLGESSGRVSMVSTAGSLLGTFLPAFLFIPWLGTPRTFLLMGFILILISAYGLKNKVLLGIAAASVLLWFIAPPVLAHGSIIYQEESAYGNVFVTEVDGIRNLYIDTTLGVQSIYDPANPVTRGYYPYFALLPSYINEPETALILGHAGGSFTRVLNAYHPNLNLRGVELDPAVTRAAEATMDLLDSEVEVIHGDARAYVNSSDQTYDLIIVDAYHLLHIPPHLATQEFFKLLSERSSSGGLVALNVASSEGEFLERLLSTLASSFEYVYTVQIPDSFNVMVLGSQQTLELKVEHANELVIQMEHFSKNIQLWNPKNRPAVFKDDFSYQVDLLNESMLRDLWSRYSL